MVTLTEMQKKIASSLVDSPKTAEQLSKELEKPYSEVLEELKSLISINLVSKQGYPTSYKLFENIRNELLRRRELSESDENKIRLQVAIEMKAIETDLMKKQFERLEKTMKSEPDFTVYSTKVAEPIKDGEYYSGFLEANLSLKDFRSLVKLVFFYGPASIEVIQPAKIELRADDFQDGLIDMADMVNGYAEYILKLMNREELSQFTRKLYSQK